MSTSDELRAAVSARRDLGPDFEDAIVESFLDKMGKEVDRRVDERLSAQGPQSRQLAKDRQVSDGMRLALAITSLTLGAGATIAMAVGGTAAPVFLIVWMGIVAVNIAFTLGLKR